MNTWADGNNNKAQVAAVPIVKTSQFLKEDSFPDNGIFIPDEKLPGTNNNFDTAQNGHHNRWYQCTVTK